MSQLSTFCLLPLLLLAACSEQNASKPASTLSPNSALSAAPANAPALGAPAPNLEAALSEPVLRADGVLELSWEHLSPKGYEPETIMAKYQVELDKTVDGSPESDALMDKIMHDLNQAPSNASLDGKRVRLPGFVSPLDEKDGKVAEFLLVPYFGACIHQPPPPVNQTLLVRPLQDKSIKMADIYNAVWVTGQMKVASTDTSLAKAGYLIENASLELYTEADEAAGAGMGTQLGAEPSTE